MPGPFFFFALGVDIVTLIVAVRFVIRPAEKTLAVLRPLCAAAILSSLAAFLLGTANGLMAMSRALERTAAGAAAPVPVHVFVAGFAEAPAPLVLAFATVAVCWLLVAVGLHRQA
jgi:hypothetical protein